MGVNTRSLKAVAQLTRLVSTTQIAVTSAKTTATQVRLFVADFSSGRGSSTARATPGYGDS